MEILIVGLVTGLRFNIKLAMAASPHVPHRCFFLSAFFDYFRETHDTIGVFGYLKDI